MQSVQSVSKITLKDLKDKTTVENLRIFFLFLNSSATKAQRHKEGYDYGCQGP